MSNDETHVIDTAIGRIAIQVYHDGNVWLSHPDTGVRVGLGRLENDERQPFVHINTEECETQVGDEPWLSVTLNDADLYDVELAGPTGHSLVHKPVLRCVQCSTPLVPTQDDPGDFICPNDECTGPCR